MDKLISEELIRQIRLMNYDRGKTISEQKPDNLMPGQPDNPAVAGRSVYDNNVFYNISKDNQDENEKEKDYNYLFTKWAPYVCGTGGGGVSTENSFGGASYSSCNWVNDGLTPNDICKSQIVDVDYTHPTHPDFDSTLNNSTDTDIKLHAIKVNKRRKEGKKRSQNGGGMVVRKDTGNIYNTYWCECKKNIKINVNSKIANSEDTGSYFRLDGPLLFRKNIKPAFPRGLFQLPINDYFNFKYCTATSKAGEWVDKHYHDIIPIVSLVLQFLGPIGIGIGAFLELTDAAKYLEEGNTYAAGLAFIFAIVGPLDSVLGPAINRYGQSILRKAAIKSAKFTTEEIKLLKGLRDTKRVMRLVKLGTAFKLVRATMLKINNWKVFGMFLLKLVNLGIISAGFLRKIGVMVGGSFISWDYIAYKYGIENTVPLKQLKQSDWKILQYLGSAGDYLQPFTTGVLSQNPEVEKIFKEAEKAFSLSQRISNALDDDISQGATFSTKLKSTYSIDVLFIQYILKSSGFAKKLSSSFYAGMSTAGIFSFTNAENISKVQIYEYNTPPLMMSKDAILKAPLDSYSGKLVKEWNPYNGKPISMYLPDAVKKGKKYFATITDNLGRQKEIKLTASFISKLFNFKDDGNYDMTFHWGYYDDFTKNAVIQYQKANGLTPDGSVGTNTFKKLKETASNIKKTTSKDIPNYNNVDMTPEEINRVRENTIEDLEELKAEIDSKLLVSEKEMQESYIEQKTEVVDETMDAIKDMQEQSDVDDGDVKILEDLFNKTASGQLTKDDLK